jgi:hypothetical protein
MIAPDEISLQSLSWAIGTMWHASREHLYEQSNKSGLLTACCGLSGSLTEPMLKVGSANSDETVLGYCEIDGFIAPPTWGNRLWLLRLFRVLEYSGPDLTAST